MPEYDKPLTPPDTPPVIDPDVDPKTAAEMEKDGEAEGDVQGERSSPDQIDTELSDKLVRRDKRDGAGEAALDEMPPD